MKRTLRRLAPLALFFFASAPALAKDRPNFDASWTAPRQARPAPLVTPPAAFAASIDARRSVPSFLWAARGTHAALAGVTPEAAARTYLTEQAPAYGLTAEALDSAFVARVHDIGRGGIVVVFRQRVGGIELFHADAKVLMTRDLGLVAIGGALHAGAVAHPKGAAFALSMPGAVARALHDLYGVTLAPADVVDLPKEKGQYRFFGLSDTSTGSAAGLALARPARVKKVFFPLPDRIVPAYYVELFAGTKTTSDAYAYVIAADDGRLLYRENLTHADVFQYRVWADASGDQRPSDGPLLDYSPYPGPAPAGTYPDFATPALVSMEGFNTNPSQTSDPWLPSGATETKGNNVDAYTDDDSPDGFSAGDVRASVTSPGVFDRVYDVHAGPQTSDEQRMAAVTQVFYVTNWLHDWWYDSGFDEAAGNAQKDNFGRGGEDGDPLRAEGQDGAPDKRNNANMSVPADGESPRMQMYVWDGPSARTLMVQPLNQNLVSGIADFGPSTFDISGSVVLADDGTGTTTDVCEAITNSVAGQIVLVDRGNCSFKQKAVNVETAGGIGMILADNQANEPPPPMADGNPAGAVSIAVQSITQADGATLKTAISTGPVSATMSRQGSYDRDGTIDNNTISHEWGHYLHLRHVACGLPICSAESEGWADFTALQAMVRDGDDLTGAYPISQYAMAASPDDPAYFGIRRYPYSVDLTKNPLTFKHIQDSEALPTDAPLAFSNAGFGNSEVHAAGEVWAAMMFEGFVALLEQSQGPSPLYTFDEARRRMSDYVEAGLTLTPPDPTYLEQRDAILAAALAADPADFQVLAEAFARRGAGTCAVAPPRDSQDFNGVVESFELKPNAAILGAALDDTVVSCDMDGFLDKGETGKVTVRIMNNGTKSLSGAKVSISSKTAGVTFPKGTDQDLPAIEGFSVALSSFEIALAAPIDPKQNLDLQVDVKSPEGCTTTATLSAAPLVNFDEVPNGTGTDDIEASTTAWTTVGPNSDSIWAIFDAGAGDHAWRGIDYASPSDTALTSPELDVSASDDFVVAFSHRHQFETSMGTFWDGGVIEISTNGGKTWKDVSTVADPGYGGTIGDPANQAQNTLKDRPGFVDQNASWPDRDPVSVNLGKSFAGQKVQVRFRIGTDDAAGEYGWEIDQVAFSGITNKPFTALVPDASACGAAEPPDADAGADLVVHGGDTVTLDGSKSTDPNGETLHFAWSETAGAEVKLSGSDAAKATFVAPTVTASTKMTFQLTVDNGDASASDSVDVRVEPPAPTTRAGAPYLAGGGCGCGVGRSGAAPAFAASAALALLGLARRRRRSAR